MSGVTLICELVRRAALARNSRTVYLPSGPPGPPGNVSAVPGNGQATVSFVPPANNGGSPVTSYTVTSNPGNLTASGATSPLVVTGLTNGTSYTFTVTATSAVGTSEASLASAPVTPAAPPSAPTITGATPVAIGAISVSFTAGADGGSTITSFTVTSSPGGFTATGAASPLTVSGLTPGTSYTFTATATSAIGTSAASAASAPVTAQGLPGVPTAVTATAGDGQATIAFTAPADNGGSPITSYRVVSTLGLTATGATSPLTVTGLSNGVAVSFYVLAINVYGESDASELSNSVVPAGVPGAPTITGVAAGNAQVTVSFDLSDNNGSPVTQYTVTSTPGGLTASGAGSPLTVTGLTNGTAYTFRMTATNAIGVSAQSNQSAAVTPATVPGAPTIGTATAGDAFATVAFTAPASNGGSPITQYTVTASPGSATATGATSPITIFGLQNGVAHTFTVTATNAIGTGPASAASNAVTPQQSSTVPGAPTIGVAARSASGACTVSFTPPSNNGGSAITSFTATSTPGGLTGSASSSPITVTGLTNGTAYTFTVHATNASGNGPESAASNAAIPAGVPSQTGTPVAVSSSGQATLQFNAPADNGGSTITSYTAVASPGPVTATATAAELNVGPLVVTGLTNGTTYSFTVYATNAYGNGPASLPSNSVTPSSGTTGPFDAYYAASFDLDSTRTFYSVPAETMPANKATSLATASYVDQRFGTRIYKAAQPTDVSGQSKLRHEYSRRCPFNANATRYILEGSSNFFLFNADTFAYIPGARTNGSIGTSTIYPRDPCDWIWHPTNPDVIIFGMARPYVSSTNTGFASMTFYEYNVATQTLTTAWTFSGRLAALGFGTHDRVHMGGEGRPSDDGRYWGFGVYNQGTLLGLISYDRQTDTILGRLLTTGSVNNITTSSDGRFIIPSGGSSLTFAQCAAAGFNVMSGTRAYTRDFTSFQQMHCTAVHADPGVDINGNQVYVSVNYVGSRMPDVPDGWVYYRNMADANDVHLLYRVYEGQMWNGHYSTCMNPTHPGWMLASTYHDNNDTNTAWKDSVVMLVRLEPGGGPGITDKPLMKRIAHHRTIRTTYWQEPQATCSRDGLRVMFAVTWDNSRADPDGPNNQMPLSYMAGLPSWVYGGGAPTAPSTGNNLVTNSTFSNLSGWTVTNGGWVASGGRAVFSPGAGASSLQQDIAFVAGKTYRVTFSVTAYTGPGDMAVRLLGGTTVASANISGVGPKEVLLTAVTGNTTLSLYAFSTFAGSIDNVVVIETEPPSDTELLDNGGFDNGLAWATEGSGWSIANGRATHAPGGAGNLVQSVAMTTGHEFRTRIDVTENTAGNVRVSLHGDSTTLALESGDTITTETGDPITVYSVEALSPAYTTVGSHEAVLVTNEHTRVKVVGSSDLAGSVDNLSLTENLINNGRFDTAAGWSLAANCEVLNGALWHHSAVNVTNAYAVALGPGTYRVTYRIVDLTAGNITMRLNTSAGYVSGTTHSSGIHPAGTYSDDLVATGNTTAFEIRVTYGATQDCKVDDIFIEKIA